MWSSLRSRRRLVAVSSSLLAGIALLAPVGSAGASGPPPGTYPNGPVSSVPAAYTPYLPQAQNEVMVMRTCGDTVFTGGNFTTIGSPLSSTQFSRNHAFSWNKRTGAVTSWNPDVNGVVQALVPSPDCRFVYLGGSFSSVGGKAVSNLAMVDAVTGAVVGTFTGGSSSLVNALAIAQGHLLLGGSFAKVNGVARSRLASLDPTTGALDSYLTVPLTGTYEASSTGTRAYHFALNHSGTKLVVNGYFTAVGGQPRRQAAMLDLGPLSVTVDSWYPPAFDANCLPAGEQFYAKGVAWSPDDSAVFMASTGYKGNVLCDAVAKFSSAPGSQPILWTNSLACDSAYTAAADNTQVYVGGHFRHMDGESGCDTNATPLGAVDRPGIGAVSPLTGRATTWDPTRSRGHGATDMELTSFGLLVGSDTFLSATKCGKAYHPGICLFPYAAG